MCGITGYVGREEALERIVEGLRRLEYRGYDSAGVALCEPDGVAVSKHTGRVDEVPFPAATEATVGIGHTRWSTHGKPTDANAHPHTDCTGAVAVVHNGIVANYDALKDELEAEGHTFASQTDTEVVAHLIEDERAAGADLLDAVRAATERLEGSYALGVVADGYDGLVVARRNSPLVIGHADDGTYVASDVTAFLDRTREFSYLEDGDVAAVTRDGVTVYDADDAVVERPARTVEWEADAAEKGGYEHYMRKEIHEQPAALRGAIAGRIDPVEHTVDLDVDPGIDLDDVEEVQFVACGTSYHAALYGKTLFQSLADVRATVEVASEYEFEGGRDPERTLVIGVTQSGETADTLRAIRKANAAGATTFGVTNTLGSTITREVADSLFIRAGPEIGVAATKTFSSQVAALAMLAVHVAEERASLDPAAGRALLDALGDLPGAVQAALDTEDAVERVAETYAGKDAYFYIGRRMGAPVSYEGALKLKEISYDHAEGFAAGELKHGPLALVDEDTVVFAVVTEGANPDEVVNNVKEVQARGASVVGASSREDDRGAGFDDRFDVPELDVLEPLVANVYYQLFAYHLAALEGRPIDKPRNLAKSVTVE